MYKSKARVRITPVRVVFDLDGGYFNNPNAEWRNIQGAWVLQRCGPYIQGRGRERELEVIACERPTSAVVNWSGPEEIRFRSYVDDGFFWLESDHIGAVSGWKPEGTRPGAVGTQPRR